MFSKDFYEYLEKNTLVEIKGGQKRLTFLQIWMVEIDKRVFVRSWNKSEKSWFTEFENSGNGQIKYGEKIIKVKGKKVDKNDKINLTISKAYLDKYSQPENNEYSNGISQPQYFDYTMEFIKEKSD